MIKIALCDDEHKMLSAVSQYVKKYAEMKSIQEPEIYFFDSVKSIENALDDEKSFDISSSLRMTVEILSLSGVETETRYGTLPPQMFLDDSVQP